ncbi:hypothetical protein [Cupriavidus sp. D384]|uniref:hypothetical protein n=1 Tax=Cupriavidus sp. D384 TaxID=1538095 RepID=UPI0012E8F497|nr:hypothetical protein [Cupriavidus sp. D384]
MKIAVALLIAFCLNTSALAEDSGLVFAAPPRDSSKLLQEFDVAYTKREPHGAILEILNPNTAGFCSLGYPAPPDAPITSIGPRGERLAVGEPARIGVIVLFVLNLALSLKAFTGKACRSTPAIVGRL